MSHKREHLESSLMRAVGTILAEGLNDPRVRGLITVTGVRVAEDGRDATVAVSILPETRQTAALAGLRHAAVHIQRRVNDELKIRVVPRIHFTLDASIKREASVLAAIRQAMDGTRQHDDSADPAGPPAAPGESDSSSSPEERP